MNDKNIALLQARLSAIPRLGLADLPTPLELLPRLGEALGGPRLWVKREDCTGLGFGGNKLRKLDFVLRAALVREGRWSEQDNVAFVHTGGAPALFAYGSVLEFQEGT